MKKAALVVLIAVGMVIGGVTPAQAYTAEKAYVNAQVNADKSASNMLMSFQKVPDGAISQGYVERGAVAGEGGFTFQNHEPQRVWINPYCSGGIRYYKDTPTTYGSWTSWRNYYGETTGLSVPVHPGNSYEGTWVVEAWLVCPGM